MQKIVGIHTNFGYYLYDVKLKHVWNIDESKFKIFNILTRKKECSNITPRQLSHLQKTISYHPSLSIIKEDVRFVTEVIKENAPVVYRVRCRDITEQEIIQSISKLNQIVIELTRECNLHCAYCCNSDMYVQNLASMTSNINLDHCLQAVKILLKYQHPSNNLYKSHPIYISFYGGEPLLKMDYMEEIVTSLREEFPSLNFIFSFTTNGLLLKRNISKLIKNNFIISVSLDGDRECNAYRRFENGKESFDIVFRNILFIKNRFPDFYKNNIKFISVLHDKTNIINLCSFFKELNKLPILTPLHESNINNSCSEIIKTYPGISLQEKELMEERYLEVYEKYFNPHDFFKNIFDINKSFVNLYNISEANNTYFSNIVKGCYLFATKIFLSVDEKIFICEKSSRNYPFGDFHNGKISFHIKKINEYYQIWHKQILTKCKGCIKKQICEECLFLNPNNLIVAKPKCKMNIGDLKKSLEKILEHYEK